MSSLFSLARLAQASAILLVIATPGLGQEDLGGKLSALALAGPGSGTP